MTLNDLIEVECDRSGSHYFHKSEIEPLITKYLKELSEKEIKQLINRPTALHKTIWPGSIKND